MIAIIAILAALLLPALATAKEKARLVKKCLLHGLELDPGANGAKLYVKTSVANALTFKGYGGVES